MSVGRLFAPNNFDIYSASLKTNELALGQTGLYDNILTTYAAEGAITVPITGAYDANVAATVYLERIGDVVTVSIKSDNALQNPDNGDQPMILFNAALAEGRLREIFRPIQPQIAYGIKVTNNNAAVDGQIIIQDDGQMNITPFGLVGFTGGAVAGINNAQFFSFSYKIGTIGPIPPP